MPRVLAIVLNWRQPEVTVECVRALQAMDYPALQILVVDNGSGDGSAATLRQELPEITLLALPRNLGFAAGSNAGLRVAAEENYPYALLVNNDAFAAPGMLAQLLAEAASDIALVVPKIFYEEQPQRLWYAGARQHPKTLDWRGRGEGELDGPQWSASRDVDYIVGTCLLVNMAAVAATGLFDEIYFMYFEDLDWSIRCRQAGYRLRLAAGAHLFHRLAMSSGGRDAPLRRYHLARSSVIFWRRHAHLGQPLLILLFRLGSAVKMVTRLLLTAQPAAAAAYLQGLRQGWRDSQNP